MVILMQQDEAGSIKDFAQKLGIVERTLYRDLGILTDLGIPCYHDVTDGRYHIRKDYFLPPVQLTAAEALGLASLTGEIAQREQIALTQPAARALEKIKGILPDHILRHIQQNEDRIEIRLPPTGQAGDAIEDVYSKVQKAMETGTALNCQYESLATTAAASNGGQDASFLFEPYALSFDQRAWYTIGRHDQRGSVRQLKLTRFTQIEPTSQRFVIPDDFSIEAFRGDAWRMIRGKDRHKVVIHIDARMAETLQDTQWHRTQEVAYHDDGSLTFTCEVEGLDEIVWWILSYGPYAHVIQPKALADKVKQLASDMVKRYEMPKA